MFFFTTGISPPDILPYKSHFWPGKHPKSKVGLWYLHPVWMHPRVPTVWMHPRVLTVWMHPRVPTVMHPPCPHRVGAPPCPHRVGAPPCPHRVDAPPCPHCLRCLFMQIWTPGDNAGVGACFMLSFFSLQSTDVYGAKAFHLDPGLCRTDPHTKVQ